MIRGLRIISYLLSITIVAGGSLCLWAVYYSRQPNVSGEILMVIPATAVFMAFLGCALLICQAMIGTERSRWEKNLFGLIAASGTWFLLILLLLGF